jgi:chorismate mutase
MHLNTTKLPGECNSKEEIRQQIDAIDKEIIALFARRFEYVQAIVKFKKDAESVVAQDRKNEVIELRGKWAEESGLDKSTFEEIYRLLIDNNIDKEMEILKKMIPQKIMVNSNPE